MAGGGVIDRDQGQAQVAYFLEQSVQRRLVGDRAFDGGDAVAAAGEGQPVEPGGPPDVEVPLNADLVPSRDLMAAGRHRAHGAPCPVARLAGSPPGVADVPGSDRKL